MATPRAGLRVPAPPAGRRGPEGRPRPRALAYDRGVNLAALDLNLLVVLDALLAEQSVSRAAKRINSTQPAVSRALGRLRAWFGDPLLTRTRTGMAPTAAGAALAREVHAALEAVKRVVERRDAFDPRSSPRAFRLTMSDHPQLVVGAVLLDRVARSAPVATFELLPWSLRFPDALESGAIDLAVCPPITPVAGLRSVALFADDLVVVVRRGHPAAARALDLAAYAALDHVVSAPNGRQGSLIDDLLEAEGLSRRVALRVPSALALPALVAGSDACATVPERLAAAFADRFDLAVIPLPIAAPTLAMNLVWHERADRDPGAAWLRAELCAAFVRPPHARARGVAVMDLTRRAKRTL